MSPRTTTRDRILAEARRQLLDRGYDGFTVNGVRDALGLSTGSMFHAFGSRAELAAAVFVEGMTAYQHTVSQALRGEEAAPDSDVAAWEGLCRLVAVHLRWVEDHPALARWLFTTIPDDVAAHVRPALAAPNRAFQAALAAVHARFAPPEEEGGQALLHALILGPAQEYCRRWIRGEATAPPTAATPVLQRAALGGLAALTGTGPDAATTAALVAAG